MSKAQAAFPFTPQPQCSLPYRSAPERFPWYIDDRRLTEFLQLLFGAALAKLQ
jgi:hypothetical protein